MVLFGSKEPEPEPEPNDAYDQSASSLPWVTTIGSGASRMPFMTVQVQLCIPVYQVKSISHFLWGLLHARWKGTAVAAGALFFLRSGGQSSQRTPTSKTNLEEP